MTRAVRWLWGKSLGFSVTMKSAWPCSAQSQNGLSEGSGEIPADFETLMLAASCRSKLIIDPMRALRTPSQHRLVLVDNLLGDKPNEGLILDPFV
jgi:hypothetical protein